MKIPGKEEINEYSNAIVVGFLKGAAMGAPISVGLRFYLTKRTNFWKIAGTFPKVLTMIAPVIFCGATYMEHSSRVFEAESLERRGKGHLAPALAPSLQSSGLRKTIDWIGDNKYKCIVAAWGATLGGCFWAVNRDRYLTKSQKIVQARVYAQGVTVIMLVASVLLSVSASKEEKIKEEAEKASHSWEESLQYVANGLSSQNKTK